MLVDRMKTEVVIVYIGIMIYYFFLIGMGPLDYNIQISLGVRNI